MDRRPGCPGNEMERSMRDRRDFLKTVAGATTGMLLTGNAFAACRAAGRPRPRPALP